MVFKAGPFVRDGGIQKAGGNHKARNSSKGKLLNGPAHAPNGAGMPRVGGLTTNRSSTRGGVSGGMGRKGGGGSSKDSLAGR